MPKKAPKVPKAPQTEATAQTVFRTYPSLLESLKQFAAWHGRTQNAELQVAVEAHVTRSMIHALNWPSFREEIEREKPDLDLDAFQREQEAHLAELEEYAVSRPPSADRIVELLP